MSQTRKVRLVVLVHPTVLARFDALSQQTGASRGELCRRALESGYAATVNWARRLMAEHATSIEAGRPGSTLVGPAGVLSQAPAPRPAVSLEDDLRYHASCLFAQVPPLDLSVLRQVLTAQAVAAGFAPHQIPPVVEAVLAERPGGTSPDVDEIPELDPDGPDVHLD